MITDLIQGGNGAYCRGADSGTVLQRYPNVNTLTANPTIPADAPRDHSTVRYSRDLDHKSAQSEVISRACSDLTGIAALPASPSPTLS